MVVDEAVRSPSGLTRAPIGYRSPAPHAAVVRLGTFVAVVLAGAWLAALFAQRQSLASGRGLTVAAGRADDLATAFGLAVTFTTAATIVWVRRVYHNLRALGVRWLRFGTGWAVWGWFVPGLNAVLPKLILDDTWRATEVEAVHPIGHRWHDRPVPGWIHLWWWLGVTGATIWLAADLAPDKSGHVLVLMVVAVVAIVSGPLFGIVVGRVSARQRSRAAHIGVAAVPVVARPRLESRITAAVVATAVLIGGYGLAVWPVAADEVKQLAGGYTYRRYGVEFVYPYRFAVVEGAAISESAGEVHAASTDGTESITVAWYPASGGSSDLPAVLDALAATVPVAADEVVYRGRPVFVVIDGAPGLLENFSIGSPSDMFYAAVAATECVASERVLTLVMLVESTRSVRNALSEAMLPSLDC